MFHRVIPTGIKHGTVTILYKGLSIETTTFRTEGTYSDGRRPDTVQFTSTIQQDLSRRDFTMNALALELPELRLLDPFGGQRDIKTGLSALWAMRRNGFPKMACGPFGQFASQPSWNLL